MSATQPDTLQAIAPSDLARRWRRSITTVRRAIAAGHLPVVVLPGSNRQLVPLDAILAAERPRIATQTTPSAA